VLARQTTLFELLQGQKQFQIPLYQRTYSWVEGHLQQLWSDILDQAALLAEDGDGATHFLGSVVLAPSPANEATFTRLLVIDGQQRLTTLLVALIAVRDYLALEAPQERDRINELYLVNKWSRGSGDYLRLLPTQADRSSFDALVRGTHTGGNDQVYETYRFFATRLQGLSDEEMPVGVADIERAITSRLALVSITADGGDNVHRIFESINNTGARLTQADLMRNHIFMRLPRQADYVYETYWLPLQSSMPNEDLERLMWLQLVLDGDAKVSQEDLYRAQQRRFDKAGAGEPQVRDYVEQLVRRSRAWLRILQPDREAGPVGANLRRLRNWHATATDPVVLLLLDAHAEGEITEADLRRGLDHVESFLVRRMICQWPTNSLARIFQAVPSQLPVGVNQADGVHRVLSGVKWGWPDDAELQEAIRTKPFYLRGRGAQRRMVLQRLEESLGHPEPIDFANANLTVEHVLPQSPSPAWLAVLAGETVDGESPAELHARLVNTLGNLTLTGANAALSNHPFDRKQDLLKASNIETNRRIAAKDRWGAAEILERADELTKWAVALWPAPLPNAAPVERRRDWSLLHQALAALPDGTWTTYGNLAALIGSHAVAVGQHLANNARLPNAYRVLTAEGAVSSQFQWPDPTDTRDVGQVLREAGVIFDEHGVADSSQQLSVQDLVALVGLAEPTEPSQVRERSLAGSEREERFGVQLAEANPPAVVAAIKQVLETWTKGGGYLVCGAATVTSCFPLLDRSGRKSIWPCVIVPATARGGGRIEVVFQYLLDRQPFGDTALREEFRTRLCKISGVTIPPGKITLRPSFDLAALGAPDNRDAFIEALTWFRDTALHS
jgi:alkylated DNA nucleotide flippase Atl1